MTHTSSSLPAIMSNYLVAMQCDVLDGYDYYCII